MKHENVKHTNTTSLTLILSCERFVNNSGNDAAILPMFTDTSICAMCIIIVLVCVVDEEGDKGQ